VLEYLPVEAVVPGAGPSTWENLHEQFDDALTAGWSAEAKQMSAFKAWLAETYGPHYDEDHIREVVAGLPPTFPPAEFLALLECCRMRPF
jgi:hypothetical protein